MEQSPDGKSYGKSWTGKKIVASSDADIYNRCEENRRLMTTRDTLLPKLMNGENKY